MDDHLFVTRYIAIHEVK